MGSLQTPISIYKQPLRWDGQPFVTPLSFRFRATPTLFPLTCHFAALQSLRAGDGVLDGTFRSQQTGVFWNQREPFFQPRQRAGKISTGMQPLRSNSRSWQVEIVKRAR
jgi:hypothetical protein